MNLFDSYVSSILCYSCEIWGFYNAKSLEIIHKKFLKRLLGVKRTTNDCAVYKETGRYPLSINWKLRILKFWFKLVNSENCILSNIYNQLHSDCENGKTNWLSNVKDMLLQLGFGYVYMYPRSVNVKMFKHIFRERMIDCFITQTEIEIRESPKLILYRELISDKLEIEPYLLKIHNLKHRRVLSKLRLSSHTLNIEYGRFKNIDRQHRFCEMCDKLTIEDEYHFILECDAFKDLRCIYIPKYYRQRPSVFKLVQLLKTEEKGLLHKLATFLSNAFQKRQTLLSNA